MVCEKETKTSNGHHVIKSEGTEAQIVKKDEDVFENISRAEGQIKKLPYPKAIFFIIGNEFCERFNYFGMLTLLVLYAYRKLCYSDDASTIIYHIFTMFVNFLSIFGAIISDSWLGKFKTILSLSLVYACGSILVTLGAIPPLNIPANEFTIIGLALVALGSGGIKPCISAFGGDQFKLPEQKAQIATFFSLFYFSINAGSLVSTIATPILREDVHCFGENECYSLAFGVPAILMAISIGRPSYTNKPPAGNMVVLVSKAIGNAIACKWRSLEKREHWLDYADGKYDKGLIEDVKVLMRVLVLYLPLPIFWALYDQQGSRWTLQATRMDGDMGSWKIKPDQLQVLNSLLFLVFIPLYKFVFYPVLHLIGIKRPLQKLTLGGILAGVAFIISGVVELKLQETYPALPTQYSSQLRIFNGESCDYKVITNIHGHKEFVVKALDAYVYRDVPNTSGTFTLEFELEATGSNAACPIFEAQTFRLQDKEAYSIFLSSKNSDDPIKIYKEFVNKPPHGNPLAKTLSNMAPGHRITWQETKKDKVVLEESSQLYVLTEFIPGAYKVLIDEVEVSQVSLSVGGVYSLMIREDANVNFTVKLITITDPNSINILWLVPQYAVMTSGEVMFSVTGLEFSYAQAPTSMKSVLQACWLLSVAFGNIIFIIVAELKLFESQASEFFFFAGLMLIDMLIFMIVAYFYKPNVLKSDSEIEYSLTERKGTTDDNKQIPEGCANNTKEYGK